MCPKGSTHTVQFGIKRIRRKTLTQKRCSVVEHLELTSCEAAERLGKVAITESTQPVHPKLSIFELGPDFFGVARCKWSLAYKAFLGGGAVLALGVHSDLERGEVLMQQP